MRPGPGSANVRVSMSANSLSVRARKAGTPNPFAGATQSITGWVRSVSDNALGPSPATAGRKKQSASEHPGMEAALEAGGLTIAHATEGRAVGQMGAAKPAFDDDARHFPKIVGITGFSTE